MHAAKLVPSHRMKLQTHSSDKRPEYVIRTVQSGAEAAIFVTTICAEGTRLQLLFIVTGSGGRYPFAVIQGEDGSSTRIPLASFLDDGAEAHRWEKPSFDSDLWNVLPIFLPFTPRSAAQGSGRCYGAGADAL